MEFAVLLVTLICYALALVLWWYQQTPIFLFTLLSGHVAALASPLWMLLYGVVYQPDLSVLYEIAGLRFVTPVVLGAAWFYSLPALLILYLYRYQLDIPFSGYLTGVIIYGGMFFYHLLMEMVGLRLGVWHYNVTSTLPLGFSNALLSIIMAALVSLALLYLLLQVYRFAWFSMLLTLLPATLALSLLIHGVLGAPLWIALFGIARLLPQQSWAITVGLLSTLALLGWAVHIICWGLAHTDRELK
jgi:hypothetical protein